MTEGKNYAKPTFDNIHFFPQMRILARLQYKDLYIKWCSGHRIRLRNRRPRFESRQGMRFKGKHSNDGHPLLGIINPIHIECVLKKMNKGHYWPKNIFLKDPLSGIRAHDVLFWGCSWTPFCYLQLYIRNKKVSDLRQIGLWSDRSNQGCQIFVGPTYQNGEKYTKWP
jgi:hypothetical protein